MRMLILTRTSKHRKRQRAQRTSNLFAPDVVKDAFPQELKSRVVKRSVCST